MINIKKNQQEIEKLLKEKDKTITEIKWIDSPTSSSVLIIALQIFRKANPKAVKLDIDQVSDFSSLEQENKDKFIKSILSDSR